MKRLSILFLALLLLAPASVDAFWHGSAITITRALGINHAWTGNYLASGGTTFGTMSRIRLVSAVAFKCVQAVIPTFWVAGSSAGGIADQDYPAPVNIQVAIEVPPYTNAITGIPARQQLTFSGSATFAYGGTGTNANGYVVSDKFCTSGIAANQEFGVWTSVEPPTSQPLTYAITALSSSGTTATASIASTTGLYVNEIFNVSGASVTGYNNQQTAITAIVPNVSVSYTTTSSNLASATTATGVPFFIPANVVSSGAVQRYEGLTPATSSAGSFVATNAVANATAITAFNGTALTASGQVFAFTPAFLLIDGYGAGDKMIFNLGDSTEYGVSAGGATNSLARDGDAEGQPEKGISWMDQGVFYGNKLNFVNGGRGSDGAKFKHDPTVWAYERNLIALSNPTGVIDGFAFNDYLQTNAVSWASTAPFYRGEAMVINGNAYIQMNGTVASPCTSGSVSPTGSVVGQFYADGTCSWAYMWASTANGASAGSNGAQGIGWNMTVVDQLKTLLPGIPIYSTTMMPNASYSASFTTLAQQSVTTTSCGARNNFDNAIHARYLDVLGATGFFDLNTFVENSPTIPGDCLWIVDNVTPNLVTFGAHPNSYGYLLGAEAIPAGSFH